MNVQTLKRHTINLLRVFLVLGTRVFSQHLLQLHDAFVCHSILSHEAFFHLRGYLHLQSLPFPPIHKSAPRLRVTVGIGDIGLDVIDGCTIHEVGSQHMDDRPASGFPLNVVNAHRGQSQTIGTKRTARSKHTHLFVTPNRGGRTMRLVSPCRLAENSHTSHKYSNSSMPRKASGFRNSGTKTILPRKLPTMPLCLGIPNLEQKGE